MAVRIADLPERERPRERLWAKGPEALTDGELIALVLRNGRHGESALALATSLLSDYGSLQRLAGVKPEELAGRPGIGEAKAATLIAALNLGRRLNSGPKAPIIRGPQDLATVAMQEVGDARRERVVLIICDASNRVVRVLRISEGSVRHSLMPVREVLNAVLRNDGDAFAIAHNHPSGQLEPSSRDARSTSQLMQAAAIVGIRFLDHIIIADTRWTSLRDSGLMQEPPLLELA